MLLTQGESQWRRHRFPVKAHFDAEHGWVEGRKAPSGGEPAGLVQKHAKEFPPLVFRETFQRDEDRETVAGFFRVHSGVQLANYEIDDALAAIYCRCH